MLGLNIDGIILEPVSSDFKSAEEQIKRAGIPYILVNSNTKESFQIDFEQMGYQTTQTLINARHTDIACLIRPGDRSAKFLQGYRQCLFDNGIPFNDDLFLTKMKNFLSRKYHPMCLLESLFLIIPLPSAFLRISLHCIIQFRMTYP